MMKLTIMMMMSRKMEDIMIIKMKLALMRKMKRRKRRKTMKMLVLR